LYVVFADVSFDAIESNPSLFVKESVSKFFNVEVNTSFISLFAVSIAAVNDNFCPPNLSDISLPKAASLKKFLSVLGNWFRFIKSNISSGLKPAAFALRDNILFSKNCLFNLSLLLPNTRSSVP